MVIPPNNISKNTGGVTSGQSNPVSQRATGTEAPAEKTSSASGDAVSLSAKGQKLAQLETSVSRHSGVDEAKVAAIKQAVESGQYQVDSQAVSQKMLEADNQFSY